MVGREGDPSFGIDTMSIYATLWVLRFPAHGDYITGCDWVTVLAQGVPTHIDYSLEFLPPPLESIESPDHESRLRAVVFVTEFSQKGTTRSGQEYVSPLLVLSGDEYATITFTELYERLCLALRGDRPRPILEVHRSGQSTRVVFEDESTMLIPRRRGEHDA